MGKMGGFEILTDISGSSRTRIDGYESVEPLILLKERGGTEDPVLTAGRAGDLNPYRQACGRKPAGHRYGWTGDQRCGKG